MSRPPFIDPKEFQQFGYLAEVNRQFFHPLGLAMCIVLPDPGEDFEPYLAVMDDREDPEGWYMGDVDQDLLDKRDRVAAELEKRTTARMASLGYVVQPLDQGGDSHSAGPVPNGETP